MPDSLQLLLSKFLSGPNVFLPLGEIQRQYHKRTRRSLLDIAWGLEAEMDVLEADLRRLQREITLSQSVEDVDKILEELCRARDIIAAGKS